MEVDYLHYKHSNLWDFSEKMLTDVERQKKRQTRQKKRYHKIIDANLVFFGPCQPETTSGKGYTFQEDEQALNL